MFALGIDYETGAWIHAVLLGAVFLCYILYCLYIEGWNYVHDTNAQAYCDIKKRFPCDQNGEGAILGGIMWFMVGAVAVMVWPIVFPALIVMGSLLLARKFVRFQKKVDKAMDK
jgi:hypothetical protein